jgi:hypothetical protein
VNILTKRESTDCYKLGIFGNHLRQWDSPDAALMECSGDFMVRWRGKGSQGPAVPCFNHELRQVWMGLCGYHAERDLYISERCPDHKLTFQGEICEAPHVGGYSLHWSTEKTYARKALACPPGRHYTVQGYHETGHHQGPGAKLMCKQFMDRDSYDELLNLFDAYPLHTVEFSCFSVRLGNLRRNTIFWEVRYC